MAYDLDDDNGTVGDKFLNLVQPLLATLPFQPAVGNHEHKNNYHQFKSRFAATPWTPALQWRFDYSFVHIEIINTEVYYDGNVTALSDAYGWLENGLMAANASRSIRPWVVVMGHRPLYCSDYVDEDGSYGNCSRDTEVMRLGVDVGGGVRKYSLEELLKKWSADLYICGHKHDYERTMTFQNSTLLQVLTGDGGNYEKPTTFWPGPQPAWLTVRKSGFGYTRLQFTASKMAIWHYAVQENGTAGEIVDSFDVTKKGLVSKESPSSPSSPSSGVNFPIVGTFVWFATFTGLLILL
jgi:hypothetical protein